MSRAVGYSRNGPPLDVAEIRTYEIASPGIREAIVQVEAAPIHLADAP